MCFHVYTMINSVFLQSGSKWQLHLSSSAIVSIWIWFSFPLKASVSPRCFWVSSICLFLFCCCYCFWCWWWRCHFRPEPVVQTILFVCWIFFHSVVAGVVHFIWCILCFISCAGCREAFLILLLYQRVWSCALCIAIACGAMILVHRCIAKFATLHKYIAYADHANFVYKPTTKNTDDEHCMQ